MCDFDSFHGLTVDGQMRVLERMLADRTPEEAARAELRAKTLLPLAVAPVPSLAGLPLDRATVSTLLPTEKHQ
jgi:hypothetical protein